MRILIPYDGSENAENALRDLSEARFAGGGRKHEVLVVISDVWLPETTEDFFRACAARRRKLETSGMCSYVPARQKLEEERLLCREASERLARMFPSWDIRVETLPGMSLPASEFLQRAETWGADLIILGSTDDYAAAQTVRQGTGAARVAKEARCAVRIAGGRNAWQTNALQAEEKKYEKAPPGRAGHRAGARSER
jgi:nucleotide-binding universal stress UspA family protein